MLVFLFPQSHWGTSCTFVTTSSQSQHPSHPPDCSRSRYDDLTPSQPHLESKGSSRAGPGDTPFQGPYGVPLHPQSPWALGWVLKLTPSHWLFLVRSLTFTSPDTVFKPRQFSDILGIPTARILAHSFKERQFWTTTGAADEAQPPPKELPSIWCWTRLPLMFGMFTPGWKKLFLPACAKSPDACVNPNILRVCGGGAGFGLFFLSVIHILFSLGMLSI